jgi:hypothetical protein|tara:strand:+ start:336 stop:485 length:150 start_codon:yes stop_codon:yes gene_type:complete
MTVYTTPNPVYPEDEDFLSGGDSYFTGKKMLVWNESEGYFEEQTQPDGT